MGMETLKGHKNTPGLSWALVSCGVRPRAISSASWPRGLKGSMDGTIGVKPC